ncbi:uncharacterized protein DS421_20g699040 [Arachis hypogaea]|nr:uncharacterized protein DS421_20g699040 [Arachis hypogaea]
MSEEKKIIVRNLGFGGLMHIPPLRVHYQILRELANSFKLGKNRLETGYGSFKVRPKIIGAALSINASGDLFSQKVNYKDLSEDDKQIFRRFQGKTLKNLTDDMMAIGVDNEQDRLMFKRIFILYIQMAFMLPTTINKISPVYLAPIFNMDTITEQNWGAHGIVKMAETKEKMKKIKKKGKKTRNQKNKKRKASSTSSSETEITDSDNSTSESETEEDSEDSPRKQPSQKSKRMESKKRKKIQEDSDSDFESSDETQSKKKKVIVEDSSPEQAQSYHGSEIGTEDLDEFLRENNEKSAAQGEKEADLRSTEGHYVSSETIPDVNLGSDDPSSQGHTDQSSVNKPAESMLSLVEESTSEPAEENMMVVREETQSETLAIVPIQVCLPLSQTTTMLEVEKHLRQKMNQPLCYKLKELQKALLNPSPQQLEESTPTLPPAPSKINPALEDVAALMMMARTASYVPKTDPMPSFSLGFTDSSQEEAATQEGALTQDGVRAKIPETPKLLEQLGDLVQKITSGGVTTKEKSPQIPKESDAESFEKFETPARTNQHSSDMKEKCYLWAIRVKKYVDGQTNEFDTVCTLQAQDRYILSNSTLHHSHLKRI